MEDILYKIYNIFTSKEELNNSKNLIYRIIKKSSVILLLSYVWVKQVFNKDIAKVNENNIIVSLTTFPARINLVWLTIISILNQSIPPSKIVIYLSEDEFPLKFKELPKSLLKLLSDNVEVKFVANNLRSHLKYFHSLQDYKNEIIITVDDDLYYPSNTIERLVEKHYKHPKCIIANKAKKIGKDNAGYVEYNSWKMIQNYCKSKDILALGYGGVLYPPSFREDILFDEEKIKELCLRADDLWLKAIQIVSGIDVVAVGGGFTHPMVIPFTQKVALRKINTLNENLNDQQWLNLNLFFGIFDIQNKNIAI